MSITCTKLKIIMLLSLCSMLGLPPQGSADAGDTLAVSIDGSRLRSQPSTKSVILQRLKEGDKLTEQGRKDKWVKVTSQQAGTSGWIFEANVTVFTRVNVPKVIIKEEVSKISGPVLRLSDLGYKTGILFEGTAANHARKLYFQVPQDVVMKRGLLRIHYRFSPLL